MAGVEFPAFLRLEYRPDGSAGSQMLADIDRALNSAEGKFKQSFAEISRVMQSAMSGFERGNFKFNFDLSGLRQTAAEADNAVQSLKAMRDAAISLAQKSGDTTRETQLYIQALRAQVIEAQQAKSAAEAQVITYTRLQGEMDKLTQSNQALAQSYRDTFIEQARATNAAYAAQQAFNSRAAPGLDNRAINNGAGYGALAELARQQEEAEKAAQAMNALRQAEADAARGNALLEATHRGTALAIGYTAKSARESAMAFEQAFRATEEAAQAIESLRMAEAAAAQGAAMLEATHRGTSLAIDATTKSARESAMVFEQAAQAQAKLAQQAQNLREAIDPSIAVQRRFNEELARADNLLEAGAISQREYAQAVALARENLQQGWAQITQTTEALQRQAKEGTTANRMVAESERGKRVAFIQTGQQLQDMAIQFQMGTRASTIFAQQVPQLAFALTSLEGSSNKTMNRIGQFATLLSGPLSIALVAVSAGLGILIDKFILSEDSAKKTGDAMGSLSDMLDMSKNSYESLMAVVNEYNDAQSQSTAKTYDAIKAAYALAEANLKLAESKLALFKGESESSITMNAGSATEANTMLAQRDSTVAYLQGEVDRLRKDLNAAGVALGTEESRRNNDPRYKLETSYGVQLSDLDEKRRKGLIAQIPYEQQRTKLLNEQTAALKAYDDAQRKARPKRERGEDTRVEAFGMPLPSGSFRSGSKFGAQRDGYKHQGVDLPVAQGTPVFATQDGQVIFASNAGAYGNLVKINHGAGTETRYGHLSRFAVKDGDPVKKGDIIGYSGGKPGAPGAGRSTGAHLHYEVRVNGKPVDPTKGAFPFDASKVAEEAEKARKDLEDFGNKSAERISRINESFDEQPRLIDRARQATRELDATIAELEERKPIGWEQMVEDAKDAKLTIEDALVRPLKEMREEGEKNIAVQRLLTAGREDEAEALERIWDYEKRIGPLKAEQKQEIFEQVRYERQVTEELQRRQEIIGAYLDATRSVKQELVSIFSGEGSFANLGKIFRNLQGQMLVEKLFGNAFRDFDKWVKGQSGLADSVDYFSDQTTEAGNAAQEFAAALDGARMQIAMPGISMGGAQAGLGLGGIAAMFGGAANDNGAAGDIVVTGGKRLEKDSVMSLSPERYFSELSKTIVGPALDGLDAIFGTKFFGKMQGVLSGAMNGYLTGGPAGGVIGALQGIPGLPKGISNELTKALKGSQTGTMVAGLGSAFGINMSSTGAQIGGAIGSLIPIPGGEIIGSIAGGLIGGLFGKRPRGAGSVSNTGITASANDAGITGSLNDTGSNLQDAIKNIADALGASVGAYSIGIGRYKDYYQVSRVANDPKLGNSYFGRDSKNAVYDGLDAEAAMAAAIGAILAQGAIKGISAASQKILSSAASKDLQAAIEKAVLIESIPKRLKALTDPVGAAIDELNKDFEKMVAALREGGATAEQFAEAQKLYELERAEAVKRAVQQVTGSLQSLYDSLTVGNDALSLRDRKSAALAIYNPLAARVAAGDASAYDAFAEAARNLLDIERQISGSQSGYFDLLKQVTDLTKSELDRQKLLIESAKSSDSPFANSPTSNTNDNQGVIDAINQQTNVLTAMNDNFITLLNVTIAAGGGERDPRPIRFQNF